MQWIQAEEGERWLDSLQLDIVGFLAILGEGSVLANAQVMDLSSAPDSGASGIDEANSSHETRTCPRSSCWHLLRKL